VTLTSIKLLPLVLMLTTAQALAQQPVLPEPPLVVTTGEGIVQAVPDRAWVTVSAESRARNPRDAQQRNAESMTPVIDKLRGAGIPAEAIRTIGYDLQQDWEFVNAYRAGMSPATRSRYG
jgi:uncharacterized protein YggE